MVGVGTIRDNRIPGDRPTGIEHPPAKASVAQVNSLTVFTDNLNKMINIQEYMFANYFVSQAPSHSHSFSSWQGNTLSKKIGRSLYPGPVGPEYIGRLSNRPNIQTMASVGTHSHHLSTEQLQLVREEVAEMIHKGAVEQIHLSEGFYSN